MHIINHKGQIYLKFQSRSKPVSRSLDLSYTKPNLAYVKRVLMPIFSELSCATKPPAVLNPATKTASRHVKSQISSRPQLDFTAIPTTPCLLSDYLLLAYAHLSATAKPTTLHTARSLISRLFDFLPDAPIASYDTGRIERAILDMQRARLHPATIKAILRYANLAFTVALRYGHIRLNPIALAQKPRHQASCARYFEPAQVRTLLATATDELRDFLHIAFYTGARAGEILALKLEDFDFKKTRYSSRATSLATRSPLQKAAKRAVSTY